MQRRKHTPTPGGHVAHVVLDDPVGGAKAGVVEEYVGDEESGIVIMHTADGASEGYDRREIVSLHGLTWLSRGPILLRPRHLLVVLRRPWGVLSLSLAVVVAGALVYSSSHYHWGAVFTFVLGCVLAVLVVALALADLSLLRRRGG